MQVKNYAVVAQVIGSINPDYLPETALNQLFPRFA
jgi:hypothetical protein